MVFLLLHWFTVRAAEEEYSEKRCAGGAKCTALTGKIRDKKEPVSLTVRPAPSDGGREQNEVRRNPSRVDTFVTWVGMITRD